jgi:large subunit ribosomal protein L22
VNSFSGRYPIKACGVILNILQSAQANAENKSLDVDRLRIIHAAAYQGIKLKRFKPRAQGTSSPKFDTTTHVEIVLDEKPTSGEK